MGYANNRDSRRRKTRQRLFLVCRIVYSIFIIDMILRSIMYQYQVSRWIDRVVLVRRLMYTNGTACVVASCIRIILYIPVMYGTLRARTPSGMSIRVHTSGRPRGSSGTYQVQSISIGSRSTLEYCSSRFREFESHQYEWRFLYLFSKNKKRNEDRVQRGWANFDAILYNSRRGQKWLKSSINN